MQIQCPACGDKYEDDLKERLIPFNGYQHHVCRPCYVAYLGTRVKTGERLNQETLHKLAKVRRKFKS